MKYLVCTVYDHGDNDFVLVRFMYNYAVENMETDSKLSKDQHMDFFKQQVVKECKELIADNVFKYFTESLEYAINHNNARIRIAAIEYKEINKFFNPMQQQRKSYTGVHLYTIEPPENHASTYKNTDPSGPRGGDIDED